MWVEMCMCVGLSRFTKHQHGTFAHDTTPSVYSFWIVAAIRPSFVRGRAMEGFQHAPPFSFQLRQCWRLLTSG
ncbi:hypothetical protein SNOG_05355 [Parastagonospora nodorum SN15]|uniref:Uncharacterized protein n=1 Tax=Phaeosphaeria nodorum (strain SN15 / ATCC MYA-4574 / FGSC 10173) TaxID=321614 RepID=Q0USA9_PHANO|nr:hypothetical protein SNOG_05355 [Parastagonospora nodorum SN15]EAT87746.1 hypothetical protein SNOG_05355 [Parastagonospora nodorum SN15]